MCQDWGEEEMDTTNTTLCKEIREGLQAEDAETAWKIITTQSVDMVITDLRLLEKTGGAHGDFRREEE